MSKHDKGASKQTLYKAIDGLGAFFCIFDELLKRERLRMFIIGGNSIYIRTNTTDIDVAICCFFEKEYDYLRCPNPEFIIDAGANVGASAVFFDCVTIENIMEQYSIDSIDLLKMDIEGGEKSVLENSEDWIDAVKILAVELRDKICIGCDRAFYLSTRSFKTLERYGEKVTAYRN